LYCVCFEYSPTAFICILGIIRIVYKSHVTRSILSYQMGSDDEINCLLESVQ
jgi:hypothetical protein